MEGTIKKLTDRGYGFIKVDGKDNDLFFHSNNLVDVNFDDLKEGDEITFEVEKSEKGENAVDVKRA